MQVNHLEYCPVNARILRGMRSLAQQFLEKSKEKILPFDQMEKVNNMGTKELI